MPNPAGPNGPGGAEVAPKAQPAVDAKAKGAAKAPAPKEAPKELRLEAPAKAAAVPEKTSAPAASPEEEEFDDADLMAGLAGALGVLQPTVDEDAIAAETEVQGEPQEPTAENLEEEEYEEEEEEYDPFTAA